MVQDGKAIDRHGQGLSHTGPEQFRGLGSLRQKDMVKTSHTQAKKQWRNREGLRKKDCVSSCVFLVYVRRREAAPAKRVWWAVACHASVG